MVAGVADAFNRADTAVKNTEFTRSGTGRARFSLCGAQMSHSDPAVGFMPYPRVAVSHSESGPLLGMSFGVKDLFDVAGYPTSAGQPLWLAQSGVKDETAPAVTRLLDAGASFAGKTITDEFAFSIIGDNAHFGSPINAASPSRYAGGSSSGSASAVAHGVVDFSLGTDTGGSVRAPASNCGIFGLRPSHGRVSLEKVHALAPSFDTCGWFARDLGVLARVSEVLMDITVCGLASPIELLKLQDLCGVVNSDVSAALAPVEARLSEVFGKPQDCCVLAGSPVEMVDCFRTIQGFEAWQLHGAWIEKFRPELGPGVRERFEYASNVSLERYEAALNFRRRFKGGIDTLLGFSRVLVLPTVGDIAPHRKSAVAELEEYRLRAFSLLCLAGLAGLPQLSMPLSNYRGAPLGLSLVGPVGSDGLLISIAEVFMTQFGRFYCGLVPADDHH